MDETRAGAPVALILSDRARHFAMAFCHTGLARDGPSTNPSLALMCRSNDLLNLVVAFTVYHTVKSSHLDVRNRSIRTRDFSQLASVTKGVALAACRRFKQATQCRAPRAETPIPEPHFIIDTTPRLSRGTVSSTIFVQGGDHFMTTTAS